jgi:hypothetical protein
MISSAFRETAISSVGQLRGRWYFTAGQEVRIHPRSAQMSAFGTGVTGNPEIRSGWMYTGGPEPQMKFLIIWD